MNAPSVIFSAPGPETVPTFLAWNQVAVFPFTIQVSGSNVTSSQVAGVAPPLSSVPVHHAPCCLVL